jgi:hypothetical protein
MLTGFFPYGGGTTNFVGMPNNTNSQVYYDAQKGQYYTMSGGASTIYAPHTATRNYLDGGIGGATPGNQSMIGQRMAQRQPFQYNAPNAQSMFPGMGMPMQGTMPTQSQGNPMLGGGNFGAGRFLGQGYANSAGLLGT